MVTAESKNSIQVIGRMMKLLEVLARHPQPVALKSLAQSSNLHPSTAHRILGALVNDRMVERVDPGSYRLGIRLLELGNLVKGRISVREHALPYMRELHAATGEAVNLSVRRDDEIVYVERTSSGRSLMRVVNIIGARAPLHITAVGKLFLLQDGAAGLRAYAQRTRLPQFTRNTLTSIAAPRARVRAHPPQRLCGGQRGGRTRRAVHRRRSSRRHRSDGRGSLGLGPGGAHEKRLVRRGEGDCRKDLARDRVPCVEP